MAAGMDTVPSGTLLNSWKTDTNKAGTNNQQTDFLHDLQGVILNFCARIVKLHKGILKHWVAITILNSPLKTVAISLSEIII